MSGIIPPGVVTVRLTNDATYVPLRFPCRVKVTGLCFTLDRQYAVYEGEAWVVAVNKFRLNNYTAFDVNGHVSVDFYSNLDNPICYVNNSLVLGSIAAPAESGLWSDDVVRDIAQMDTDEWLELLLFRSGGGGDAEAKATVSIMYEGATNLD